MIVRGAIALSLVGTTVLAVLAWRHWTDDTNVLPIDRLLTEDQQRDLGLLDESDQPLIVLVPGTTDTFLLINRSSAPLKYYGEPMTGRKARPPRGLIEPHYRFETVDDGQWKKQVAWMHAGVEMIVPPGCGGRFRISIPERGTYRVGVRAQWTDPAEGVQTETLWGPVIKR